MGTFGRRSVAFKRPRKQAHERLGSVQSMSNNCSNGFRCGLLVATRVPQVLEKVEIGYIQILSPRPILIFQSQFLVGFPLSLPLCSCEFVARESGAESRACKLSRHSHISRGNLWPSDIRTQQRPAAPQDVFKPGPGKLGSDYSSENKGGIELSVDDAGVESDTG